MNKAVVIVGAIVGVIVVFILLRGKANAQTMTSDGSKRIVSSAQGGGMIVTESVPVHGISTAAKDVAVWLKEEQIKLYRASVRKSVYGECTADDSLAPLLTDEEKRNIRYPVCASMIGSTTKKLCPTCPRPA